MGVINTVQLAAQNALQSGWSILLPTAEERARTLSTLLSNEGTALQCGRKAGKNLKKVLIYSVVVFVVV